MYCELINITPDENDEYLNMYILTKWKEILYEYNSNR
jgi:hypothetical protein